jgi:hypothetical protein
MDNKALAAHLIHLLHQVNQAKAVEGNTIDHAYSRQDSVYGKLHDALEIVAPERLQAYIETGDPIL